MSKRVNESYDAYNAMMYYSSTRGKKVFRMFVVKREKRLYQTFLDEHSVADISPIGLCKVEDGTFAVLTDKGYLIYIRSLAENCDYECLIDYLKKQCKKSFNVEIENAILRLALKNNRMIFS
jgi:hypothetical protein